MTALVGYTFVAEGRPRAKGRPRATRTGRVYTPAATIAAERELAAQYEGPKFEGPVAVTLQFHKDYQWVTIMPLAEEEMAVASADIDNLTKLTLDALNGVAWNDDHQVVRLTAVKMH